MLANDSSKVVKVTKENYEVKLYIDPMKHCQGHQKGRAIYGSDETVKMRNSASIMKDLRPLC